MPVDPADLDGVRDAATVSRDRLDDLRDAVPDADEELLDVLDEAAELTGDLLEMFDGLDPTGAPTEVTAGLPRLASELAGALAAVESAVAVRCRTG